MESFYTLLRAKPCMDKVIEELRGDDWVKIEPEPHFFDPKNWVVLDNWITINDGLEDDEEVLEIEAFTE